MSVNIYSGDRTTDDVLNVSNTNFCRLMDLIGADYDRESLAGEWTGAALLTLREQVRFALEAVRVMPDVDRGLAGYEWPRVHGRGARVIEMGLPSGYFADRLSRLLAEIETAIEAGRPLRYA